TSFAIPCIYFVFSSRRRHTSSKRDWSSDVCSSDLEEGRGHAIGHGMTTAFFSLEMSKTEIAMRLLSSEATISLQDLRKGTLDEEIGRASCREEEGRKVAGGSVK